LGKLDDETLMPLVGFDAGGPLSFCTVGRKRGDACVTYVSCELAVREDQEKGKQGSYEVLMACDDEQWAKSILTNIGWMSLEVVFEDSHTLDIAPWVEDDASLQGILFEEFARVQIEGEPHGILRRHGVTRPEMEFASRKGADRLLSALKSASIYPNSLTTRSSIPLE